MPRFRTKPVEIEAVQYQDNFSELINWTDGNFRMHSRPLTAQVFDKLHNTWIFVYPGQWIVRGAKGEFYPCDNETFFWKYEEINGEQSR